MKTAQLKKRLSELQIKQAAYDHALSLLSYDGATTAPKGTADNRGRSMSVLSEESYKLATSARTVALLEELDARKDELSEEEKRQVFLLLKDIRQMQKIPMKEYIAFTELTVKADDVWHTAKLESDFPLFEPYLKEIFETTKRFAGYMAPDRDPYDFWLGEYEDGLDKAACDVFFSALRKRLVPLLRDTAALTPPDDGCLKGNFPIEKQRKLSEEVMKIMGLDLAHVGLSETEHPFTTSLGSHLDVRITTHYHEDDFASSLYSVIHEGGHALYDSGSLERYAYTTLDGGVTMGIHESQSRFYENILGRSLPFLTYLYPTLRKAFPSLKAYGPEDLFRALNRVTPSLIRTEADEVTYSMHVMVRYELEKAVMNGDLSVHDLPGEWNRLYKEYLGVDVPDDRRGVLQDSHWSGGGIGYFPSYALGSAYGAQFLQKMKETVDVDGDLLRGDFSRINAWNREHIWQHGRLYPSDKLLSDVLGGPFDPDVYLTYLEDKVRAVYKTGH